MGYQDQHPMKTRIVDVAINVLGKPAQTALALFSLLAHSGRWIDKIYFIEERGGVNDAFSHADTLAALGERVIRHCPSFMNWRFAVDPTRLGDETYRHALRYQYAFERTDKKYLLLIHNDCEFVNDVVGLLLGTLGGHIGAGEVGQCWLCPAGLLGCCGPGRFMDYQPDFAELAGLYAALDPTIYRRKYLEEPTEELRLHPWPLPECRLNEFCCLLNMRVARPVTCPHGPSRPFGAYVDVGNAWTGNGILDIGVAWFGDVVRLGHTFSHVPLAAHVQHSVGHKALFVPDMYVAREEAAIAVLQAKYGRTTAGAKRVL
jgi:hypothetical protein